MKLLFICLLIGVSYAGVLKEDVNKGSSLFETYMVFSNRQEYINDTYMTMLQLLEKHGYPGERHEVRTEDGYLLTLYRIPYGRECGKDSQRRPAPVLIQHGVLSSSIDFIIMGPSHGLGYILADDCYDVWLGNNRGNSQSRKHETLEPDEDADEFWNFSWHELGLYDVPATIDYILEMTGHRDLYYVGHSMGTTQFFVFGSLKPEYHKKVRAMFALAPVAWMDHVDSVLLNLIAQFSGSLEWLTSMIGLNEFLPSDGLLNLIGRTFCKDSWLPLSQTVCENVLFLMCGFDAPQMNETMLPVIMGHSPAGASTKEMIHYAQLIDYNGHFKAFDYGRKTNNVVYGQKTPPDYELDKIDIPIALYYGANDKLAQYEDVKQLKDHLPHALGLFRVKYDLFNHLDFMWAIDVRKLLYNDLLSMIHRF